MEEESISRAYQYKLKPTKEQERLLERLLSAACQLYNDALRERKEAEEGFLLEIGMGNMSSLRVHLC